MASKLHVLISGAGIAGLMAGALLEKAGISYEVRLPVSNVYVRAVFVRWSFGQ